MIQLSIVSGTYNRLSHLQRMVASARASMNGLIAYEFVLVDGGSTDGTLEWCKSQADVMLIEQGELLGAIKAFNAGFKAARGRYVVIGNDDIEYIGSTLPAALVYMDENPGVGIGCFEQDRNGRPWHIETMPAHYPDGRNASVPYGQVCIVPRDLLLQWGGWGDFGARTYGGDCYLSARAVEAGYKVEPIFGARIHDTTPNDDLRRINQGASVNNQHPDTQAYYRLYPRGARLGAEPARRIVRDTPLRILYAPIYEPGHSVQKQQKCGLRRALGRIGSVWEIDYLSSGVKSIIEAAAIWRPHLFVGQFHDANVFTANNAADLARYCLKTVSWNGDVYDRSGDDRYAMMLSHFDLATFVNDTAVQNYRAKGVKAAYWQIGYEPDGVGYEPDERTKRHAVVLLGNGYSEQRQALAAVLADFDTGIYGGSWPPGVASGDTLYDFRTGCQIYQGAKLSIGDSQWPDEARGFVSNRLFQALAAGGAMLLHQRFAGMEELIGLRDGVHLVIWNDFADLRAKIAYYLAHEDERARIAAAGHIEVLRNHSFEKRVAELRNILEPPAPAPDPTLAAFFASAAGFANG